MIITKVYKIEYVQKKIEGRIKTVLLARARARACETLHTFIIIIIFATLPNKSGMLGHMMIL